MFYGLVYYPDADLESMRRFRRKYDPTADLVEPHLTIVFPVSQSIGEERLANHVAGVLRQWEPFTIRTGGFRKSPDHWLLLGLEEGNDEVVRLYRQLHTGILAEYRRDDLFHPHVALGLFVKAGVRYEMMNPKPADFDKPKYEQALREAEALRLQWRCVIDRLHLIQGPDEIIRWAQGEIADLSESPRMISRRELPLG